MLGKTKKILFASLLLFITFSFSGCMGIPLPGEKSGVGTSAERNDSQGIFKTKDGGKTWKHKVTIEGNDKLRLDQIKVESMAINPDNTQVLYVGTLGNGVYKTENGADSWRQLADQNNKLRKTASVYDLAVEKGNSSIVYAATLNDNRGVLAKTEDGGTSWTESYISTELGKQINRIQIDPVNKNVVYIGTEQGGFLKSTDRGQNWIPLKWFDAGVEDFVIDYTNPKNVMVLTHKGLYKAQNGGYDDPGSWQDLTKTLNQFLEIRKAKIDQITSLTIDNQNPLVIYMTYQYFIFVTRDGGGSWTTLDTITPAIKSSSNSSKNTPSEIKKIGLMDGTIYYGAGNALYKSDNKGESWSSFDVPIEGDLKSTVYDPNDHNIIYVGALFERSSRK